MAEVETAWSQVEAISSIISLTLDSTALSKARSAFCTYPLDGYDLFFVDQMASAGVSAIITDDVDFIYVPNIDVYTCNADSIGRARLFKKLE